MTERIFPLIYPTPAIEEATWVRPAGDEILFTAANKCAEFVRKHQHCSHRISAVYGCIFLSQRYAQGLPDNLRISPLVNIVVIREGPMRTDALRCLTWMFEVGIRVLPVINEALFATANGILGVVSGISHL